MASDPAHGHTDEEKAALVERILRGDLTPEAACAERGLSRAELTHWVRVYRWAARRAIDEQVIAALSARGLTVDDLPATEFSGGLDSMGVSELVQTIQYGRKDAHIRVTHGAEQSDIWCVQGDIVDAQSTRLVGSAALYRLMLLKEGQVHADFSAVRRARIIHASTQALLLESAKRSDDCRELRARLGDTRAIYVASAHAPTDSPLEPQLTQVLREFDGASSVDDVVHMSLLPDLETLLIIRRLLDESWLTPKPQAMPAARLARRAASQRLPSSVLPTVLSGQARSSRALSWPQRLWGSAVLGLAVVSCAFVIGFWSTRNPSAASPAGASEGAAVARAVCPPGMGWVAGRFCLGQTEVTAAQYQACVAAGACEPTQSDFGSPSRAPLASAAPASRDDALHACNGGRPGREQFPINCLTFPQSRRYCEWQGGRLPSAAEWELAAQPGNHEAAGILDLLGGVSEWTTASTPARPELGGSGDAVPPERFVVLGGGLESGSGAAAAPATRLYMNASAIGRNVGFRCASSLQRPGSAS
jgi:hypothetical protein